MLFDFPDRGSRDLQHNTYESLHSDLISIRFQQGRPIHGIRGAASILDLLHIGILHEPYPSLFILVSLRALLTWRSHIHCPLFASSPTQLTIRPQHGQNSWLLSLIPRVSSTWRSGSVCYPSCEPKLQYMKIGRWDKHPAATISCLSPGGNSLLL